MLFAVIFLVYGQILSFSLGKLDEYNIILVNIDLLKDFANLKTVVATNPFFNKGGEFYRPLQNLSFMMDAHISGEAGWGYYLTNILLHATACSILFYLLILLGSERLTALLLALAYAVHPLFVQTVAWAPSRGDMLITVFGLLSFTAFIRYARTGGSGYLMLHLASYLLALFSKESAIVLPAACYLWYVLLCRDRKIPKRVHILVGTGYIVIIVLFLFLRGRVADIRVPAGEIGFLAVLSHLRTIPELILKFFVPVHLSPMPGYDTLVTLAGILLVAVLVYIAIKSKPASWKTLIFGFTWFLLFMGPSLVFVNKYGGLAFDYMEHRAYLPMAGLLIFIALWVSERAGSKAGGTAPAILLVIVLIFGFGTVVYSRNYQTGISFFTRAVESNPGSAVAWYCRGTVLIVEDNDCKLARPDLDKALELWPGYGQAFLNRGYCKEQEGDAEGAISDYLAAAKSDPSTYEPHAALAFLYTQEGKKTEALSEYNIAISLYPGFEEGLYHRALIYMDLNEYESALSDLNNAIRIHGNHAEAYLYRGVIYFQMNDIQNAGKDLDRAILLDPSLVKAYVNRGVLRFQTGDVKGAIADLDKAIALDAKSAEAFLNRGRILYQFGNEEEARSDWRQAAVLGSREAEILLEKY